MTRESADILEPSRPLLPPRDRLFRALRRQYARLALFPERPYHLHSGAPLAAMLGYPRSLLEDVPQDAVRSFSGAAFLFALEQPAVGARVLDVGSGGGMDALLAARMVGALGSVIGLDITAEMLSVAREAAGHAGLTNVEFREGEAEALPIPDASVDVVIANNVLNHLVLDKERALAEAFRVVRPGGRLLIGDVVLERPVPDSGRAVLDLWIT